MLALIASTPFIIFPSWFHDVAYRGDFANFWSAGSTVGTPTLLDFSALSAWQTAHHVTPQSFVYPPAFAWSYAPLRWLTPLPAMLLQDALMLALLVASAFLAARIYGFARWFCVVAVFAWGPALSSVELGQNTALALLLTFGAVLGLKDRREILAGIAVGLLLYKPSVAFAFVVLLLVRAQWRALGIAGLFAAVWYLLSVVAAHGDWSWPVTYIRLIAASNAGEFAGNAHKAYTIPTLLLAGHAPAVLAYALSAALFVFAFALLARVPALEAASIAPLVGLATSIHSWPYEAALLLPAAFYAMLRLREPARTTAVASAYAIAAFALVLPYSAHALAILPIGGAAWWLLSSYRRAASSARPAEASS